MAFKPITVNTPAADPAHILAEDDAALYESIIGGDCVLPIGQKMAATVQSNNKVRIADGVVVVGGHVGRIVTGDYEDMTIANGQSGQKRNDIIAARFLAGSSGGSDSYSLVVIQGTPGTSATDPVVVKGDLYAGDKQRDYPLWRVCIDGLSITKVEQMYEVATTVFDLSELFDNILRRETSVALSVNANQYKTVSQPQTSVPGYTYLLGICGVAGSGSQNIMPYRAIATSLNDTFGVINITGTNTPNAELRIVQFFAKKFVDDQN